MSSIPELSLPRPAIQRLPATAGTDVILAALEEAGGVIITSLLSADQLSRLNKEIDVTVNAMKAGPPEGLDAGMAVGYGNNTKRINNLVMRSKVFQEEVLEHELVHSLVEQRLAHPGDYGYWLDSAQVIEIGPGNPAQVLHRDQSQYPPFEALGPSGNEAMVNFLVALTPFKEENGATRIIPGSHKWKKFDLMETMAIPTAETTYAQLDPGDCVFISGKVIHGGGPNQTLDQYRRGLAFTFIQRYLLAEEAHPLLVSREVADKLSYRSQAMLGFRSIWPITRGTATSLWCADFLDVGSFIGLKDNRVAT